MRIEQGWTGANEQKERRISLTDTQRSLWFFRKLRDGRLVLRHSQRNRVESLFASRFYSQRIFIRSEFLFADELLEIKVAVEVGFYIDFIPSHSCEMHAQEALRVQLFLAVLPIHDVYVAGAFGCDSVEFRDVGRRYKLDFVKIFAVADHKICTPFKFRDRRNVQCPADAFQNVLSAIGSTMSKWTCHFRCYAFLSLFPSTPILYSEFPESQ